MRLPANQFFGIYNDTFIYLESIFGKEAVLDIWNEISNTYGKGLDVLIKKYGGIEGSYEFWDTGFKKEKMDYSISKGEDFIEITVKNCVPIVWKRKNNVKNYKDYCEHCDALYTPILRKNGYRVNLIWDINGRSGECKRRITKINKYGN